MKKPLLICGSTLLLAVSLWSLPPHIPSFQAPQNAPHARPPSSALSELALPEQKVSAGGPTVRLTSPRPEPRSAEELIGAVREISNIALPSGKQKAEMNRLLASPLLQKRITEIMADPSLLSDEHFHERTAALDVLYEGLKSEDAKLHSAYADLAERVLTQELRAGSRQEREAFFGDRVELALAAGKISMGTLSKIKGRAETLHPASQAIFATAARLSSIYQVSL